MAEDIQTKKQYAVKILKKIKDSDFENEKKMLIIVSKLKNPYIVNLIDFGEEKIKIDSKPEENHKYIIMDYASKGELYRYIKCNGGLEKKAAKLIFHKLLKGLEAIHKSGICHRDLKLKNILMDEFFNPKICDFGLAGELKGKDGSGMLHEFVGTIKYAAPEMYEEKAYDGVKADIFSMGVVLLNITIGKHGFVKPLKGESYYKYIYNNDSIFWEIIGCGEKELDDSLKELYLKMVSYEQKDRPTIKEILESNWMKEIKDLNESEYKDLEKEVIKEFQEIEKKMLEANGTITVKESNHKNESGDNRGLSEGTIYFELDLVPKYVLEDELNMRHYLKIIGNVSPCLLMNNIANRIKKTYGDKIDIIPNKYKLKFDIEFDDMEEISDEEENNEEEGNEEDNKVHKNRIKNENSVIKVQLFESTNGGYIVEFTRKKGESIEFYQYLEELRNTIKEMYYV